LILPATFFIALFCADDPTRDPQADVKRPTNALEEQSLSDVIWPSVNRDHVGRDVADTVVCRGFSITAAPSASLIRLVVNFWRHAQ